MQRKDRQTWTQLSAHVKDGTFGKLWRVCGGGGVTYLPDGRIYTFGGMRVEYNDNGQIRRIGSHAVTYNKQGLIEHVVDYPRVEYTNGECPRLKYFMDSNVVYYYFMEEEYNRNNIEPEPEAPSSAPRLR